jgi:hypothetical protein
VDAGQLAVVGLRGNNLAQGEQLERLVGVQRGVAERCPAVLVVVTDRVEGGVAVVAATEEVRRVVAVGSENSAFRASG